MLIAVVKAGTKGKRYATTRGVRWRMHGGAYAHQGLAVCLTAGQTMGGVVIVADATAKGRAQAEIDRLLTETGGD
jgi:hypothetical protein